MYKKLFLFSALLMNCTIFNTLSAQQVDSFSKPVGIIRINSNSNSQRLSSNPFEPFDSSINAIFGQFLTGEMTSANADTILKWNPIIQDFISAFKLSGTGTDQDETWVMNNITKTASGLTFTPGDAFYIQNKHSLDANQVDDANIFLMGKVVLQNEDIPVNITPGFNMISYPFSAIKELNASSLENGAQGATTEEGASDIITSNVPNERGLWLLDSDRKWYDGTILSNFDFLPGRGIWYNSKKSTSTLWNASSDYFITDLFSESSSVEVTAMQVNPAKNAATLTIKCTGEAGEKLEIFYHDIGDWKNFDSESGWKIAAENILTNNQHQLPGLTKGKLYMIFLSCQELR